MSTKLSLKTSHTSSNGIKKFDVLIHLIYLYPTKNYLRGNNELFRNKNLLNAPRKYSDLTNFFKTEQRLIRCLTTNSIIPVKEKLLGRFKWGCDIRSWKILEPLLDKVKSSDKIMLVDLDTITANGDKNFPYQ